MYHVDRWVSQRRFVTPEEAAKDVLRELRVSIVMESEVPLESGGYFSGVYFPDRSKRIWVARGTVSFGLKS